MPLPYSFNVSNSLLHLYINYIILDPCVILLKYVENTDHIYRKYDNLAYFRVNIAILSIFMLIYLYYALHFVIIFKNDAGVEENIVDFSVQIAPNKELAKSQPGCHIFKA